MVWAGPHLPLAVLEVTWGSNQAGVMSANSSLVCRRAACPFRNFRGCPATAPVLASVRRAIETRIPHPHAQVGIPHELGASRISATGDAGGECFGIEIAAP